MITTIIIIIPQHFHHRLNAAVVCLLRLNALLSVIEYWGLKITIMYSTGNDGVHESCWESNGTIMSGMTM